MFQFTQSESNSVRRRIFFYAVDATDGFTAVTTGLGASTSVEIVKNGVTPATVPISPSFTHISNGLWYYEMIAGHLDTVGVLTLTISDALIRTLQLIGYVYSGDPLSAIPAFPTNFSSLAISVGGEVTVGTINSGVITATSIATDAITAAKIADSAITIRLSTDATASEARLIAGTTASDVWNALVASYVTVDTFGARLPRVTTGSASNQCELNASHHIAANVHQMQAGVVTAASIATDAIDADALAADASNEIADALLNRNVGGGSSAGRLVKEALYALRNKSEIVGATLSVYDASDALSWTATVASSSSADPVTGIDP